MKTPQNPPKEEDNIYSVADDTYTSTYTPPPRRMATLMSLSSRLNTTLFPIRRKEFNRRRIILVTSCSGGGKPTILVAEKLGQSGIDLLKKFANVDCSYDLSLEELCTKISLCDALIVRSGTRVGRDVFEASRGRLKVVGRAGVGIDNVDLAAATEYGCLVVNAPTANTVAAAEHGIALLVAMARNVAQADASIKSGEFTMDKKESCFDLQMLKCVCVCVCVLMQGNG